MELKDLVGPHQLDAVDMDIGGDSGVRFRLDGVVYEAAEDTALNDGYRSSMRDLVTGEWPMRNVFPRTGVIGVWRDTGEPYCGDKHDVLELHHAVTGQCILAVGTENWDDYYPGFVLCFDATALGLLT